MVILILEHVDYRVATPRFLSYSTPPRSRQDGIHGTVASSVSLKSDMELRQEEAHAATLQCQEIAREVEGHPGAERRIREGSLAPDRCNFNGACGEGAVMAAKGNWKS